MQWNFHWLQSGLLFWGLWGTITRNSITKFSYGTLQCNDFQAKLSHLLHQHFHLVCINLPATHGSKVVQLVKLYLDFLWNCHALFGIHMRMLKCYCCRHQDCLAGSRTITSWLSRYVHGVSTHDVIITTDYFATDKTACSSIYNYWLSSRPQHNRQHKLWKTKRKTNVHMFSLPLCFNFEYYLS